jgi:hypothetical protein
MKSLRHIGLAVVVSLGASQGFAGNSLPEVTGNVPSAVVTPVVTTGFWKNVGNSIKATCNKGVELAKKTLTKENCGKAWGFVKDNVTTGFNKTVEFGKKYGTKGIELIKKNKKTSALIAGAVVTTGILGTLAYKYGLFGKVKNGAVKLFKRLFGKKPVGGGNGGANHNKQMDVVKNPNQQQELRVQAEMIKGNKKLIQMRKQGVIN